MDMAARGKRAETPPKKPKTKPKSDTSGSATAERLNDEQLQSLFFQHKTLYEKEMGLKKKQDASFKNACKLIKSEGGSVTDIKRAIQLDTDEGEKAVKADLEATLRIARWMGASIGSQFDMFADRTPAADRAYDEGKRAGMKAEARNGGQYDPSTEQYRKWMEGFDHGQDVNKKKLADGMKPLTGGAAAREAVQAGDAHIKGLIGDAPASHVVRQ